MKPNIMMSVHTVRVTTFWRFFARSVSGAGERSWIMGAVSCLGIDGGSTGLKLDRASIGFELESVSIGFEFNSACTGFESVRTSEIDGGSGFESGASDVGSGTSGVKSGSCGLESTSGLERSSTWLEPFSANGCESSTGSGRECVGGEGDTSLDLLASRCCFFASRAALAAFLIAVLVNLTGSLKGH